jgi:hypothetical protein
MLARFLSSRLSLALASGSVVLSSGALFCDSAAAEAPPGSASPPVESDDPEPPPPPPPPPASAVEGAFEDDPTSANAEGSTANAGEQSDPRDLEGKTPVATSEAPEEKRSADSTAAATLDFDAEVAPEPSDPELNASRDGTAGPVQFEPRRDGPGGWSRIFLAGPSPGDPSAGKQVVVLSMYGLALVGLGASAYLYVDHFQDGDRTEEFLAANRSPGACYDFLSADCEKLEALRQDERDSLNLANMALAASGSLLLGGVLTATLWDNVQTYALPTSNGATLHVRLNL